MTERLLLSLHLALRRYGWVDCAILAVCAALLAACAFGAHELRRQHDGAVAARLAAERALLAARAPSAAQHAVLPAAANLANFYDTLGEAAYAEQQVKALFALAAKNALVLSQADYKMLYNKDGRYAAYQVNVPVRGSYAAVRKFAEQILLTIPFASLDQIQFRRDAIGNTSVESRLKLTIYLADKPHGGMQ